MHALFAVQCASVVILLDSGRLIEQSAVKLQLNIIIIIIDKNIMERKDELMK